MSTTADFHVKGAIWKQERDYGGEKPDCPNTRLTEAMHSKWMLQKSQLSEYEHFQRISPKLDEGEKNKELGTEKKK